MGVARHHVPPFDSGGLGTGDWRLATGDWRLATGPGAFHRLTSLLAGNSIPAESPVASRQSPTFGYRLATLGASVLSMPFNVFATRTTSPTL